MKTITKVKVVSKNIFLDFTSRIRNILGKNLPAYEDMLKKAKIDIWNEIEKEELTVKWYRYEITELTNGALMVLLYGECEE